MLRAAVKTVNQATRAGSALLNQKKRESFKLIKLGHSAGELGEQGVSASHDTVFTGDTLHKKREKRNRN